MCYGSIQCHNNINSSKLIEVNRCVMNYIRCPSPCPTLSNQEKSYVTPNSMSLNLSLCLHLDTSSDRLLRV